MTTRFPEPADPFEEQGLASADPELTGKRMTGDDQDDPVVPAENPVAVDDFGTTAAEEAAGEPLDLRLSREEPEVGDVAGAATDSSDGAADPYPADADERAGRLVAPDEGAHTDAETDEVATSVGTDQGGFTEEERAMHIEPER
jgi:hypothetical protein